MSGGYEGSRVELVEDRISRGNRFSQQNLNAWQPFFDASYGSRIFFTVGVIFILIGAGLLSLSITLQENIVDYTDCVQGVTKRRTEKPCVCKINFTLPKEISGPVFVYYALSNFYRNHRSFARSISFAQLQGLPVTLPDLQHCYPLISSTIQNQTFPYMPCGLVTNSIFNDTFNLTYHPNASISFVVPMTNSKIAWVSDITRSYGTIPDDVWPKTIKPPNWPEPANVRSPGAFKSDEELMVWNQRTPLSSFRKLHRRIMHDASPFSEGLPAGTYQLDIVYDYPGSLFGVQKSLIIANVNWMGGKNNFLGSAFICDGIFNILLGGYFLAMHKLRKISYAIDGEGHTTERQNQLPELPLGDNISLQINK